jgi:hypothetical protein
MTKTASDVLIETIQAWAQTWCSVGRGRNQRNHRGSAQAAGIGPLHSGTPRRSGSLYGLRLRQTQPASWGRCVATSGPGGIHLLTGLYDAKLDGQPVLAITGLQFHDLLHTHTQQDVALDRVFGDVCAYNERCTGPAHMENIAELACLGLSRLSRATFTPR